LDRYSTSAFLFLPNQVDLTHVKKRKSRKKNPARWRRKPAGKSRDDENRVKAKREIRNGDKLVEQKKKISSS
jgi:hypothetical protein